MTTYTWTDNAMRGGTACDVDKVADNLMHLKYDNVSPQDGKIPYSVTSGKQDANGYADFIQKDSDTQITILAGNSNPNLGVCYPDGSTETISSDIVINSGLSNNGTYTFLKEKGNSTPVALNISPANQNLLVDFNDGTANDKYGNTLVTIGSPTYTNNKFNSNGTTGLKYTTINTLGQGSWCLEGRFKFNTNNTQYYLFANSTQFGIRLYRHSNNKLLLDLSSNGSSYDIASDTIGAKADFDTTSEYHIALEFDGSSYKVYVNGILDQVVTSSSKVYSSLPNLIFGVSYDSSTSPLAGTMDDLRVTIGNTRYAPTGTSIGAQYFTPPASGSLTVDGNQLTESLLPPSGGNNGDYWLQYGVRPYQPYKKVSGSWTATQFVKLGEASKASGTLGTPVSYAFNGVYDSGDISTTSGNNVTKNHNIGSSKILSTLYENNIQVYKNITPAKNTVTWTSGYTGTSRIYTKRSF